MSACRRRGASFPTQAHPEVQIFGHARWHFLLLLHLFSHHAFGFLGDFVVH